MSSLLLPIDLLILLDALHSLLSLHFILHIKFEVLLSDRVARVAWLDIQAWELCQFVEQMDFLKMFVE